MEKITEYAIGSSLLTYDLIERILKDGAKLTLSEEAVEKIQHCRDFLDSKTDENNLPKNAVRQSIPGSCFMLIFILILLPVSGLFLPDIISEMHYVPLPPPHTSPLSGHHSAQMPLQITGYHQWSGPHS